MSFKENPIELYRLSRKKDESDLNLNKIGPNPKGLNCCESILGLLVKPDILATGWGENFGETVLPASTASLVCLAH